MDGTFNPQILVEKLAKLNSSQQSIETLSHWCIFHMNKAKLVVETWERQFHCSSREQRLAFLYLANDILQNSRKKGADFVAEFWRVLPEALRDVIRSGDDSGKKAAFRLIKIWEERKVFGSRGQILKEEFMGKQPENNNRNSKQQGLKLRPSAGTTLDKIISDYEVIYGGQFDEDAVLSRCSNTIGGLEKVIKDIGSEMNSGQSNGSELGEELQVQHAALRESIGQLTALEASRSKFVLHLTEALQEQELKLDQVRSQLRAAQLQSEQAANLCQKFVILDNGQSLDEQAAKEAHASSAPPGFASLDRQSAPVVYTRQLPLPEKAIAQEDDSRKSAAAAVAAKLTASTASAEMLSHVLTSLVSGGIIGNSPKESPGDQQRPEKKPKLENDPVPPPPPPPSQQPPPPLPPFPHPDSFTNINGTPTNNPPPPVEQPPPPSSSPPPLPPLPPVPPYPMAPQFIQTAGSMSNVSYSYGAAQQPPLPPLPGYPSMVPYGAPPVNLFQNFQGSEGGFYTPPSTVPPMAPISRQQTL